MKLGNDRIMRIIFERGMRSEPLDEATLDSVAGYLSAPEKIFSLATRFDEAERRCASFGVDAELLLTKIRDTSLAAAELFKGTLDAWRRIGLTDGYKFTFSASEKEYARQSVLAMQRRLVALCRETEGNCSLLCNSATAERRDVGCVAELSADAGAAFLALSIRATCADLGDELCDGGESLPSALSVNCVVTPLPSFAAKLHDNAERLGFYISESTDASIVAAGKAQKLFHNAVLGVDSVRLGLGEERDFSLGRAISLISELYDGFSDFISESGALAFKKQIFH